MSISLAELDRWNPDSIREVFQTTTARAEATQFTADSLKKIIASVPWEGEAYDAAVSTNLSIVADLELHASEVDAVARAAGIAEVEIRAVKRDWQRICRLADRWGITIDVHTNEILPPRNPPATEAERDEVERHMQILHDEIVDLLERANDADRDLAAAIDGAGGLASAESLNRDVQGITPEQQRQAEVFTKVFGRSPVTPEDWAKASWLDPTNADPVLKGVNSSVVVANIKPVPGQGTVRGSLFIMEEKVLDPFAPDGFDLGSFASAYDYGNNRGFSAKFDPRNAKGAFLIDYDSGVVIFRQNPTHDDDGHVVVGDPNVVVKQASDGTVRLDYNLPNPAAMAGPVNMADALGKPVSGTVFVTPGADGPRASGVIGDYPSAEIYADPSGGGSPRTLLQDEQDNHTSWGPILELGTYHEVGQLPSAHVQRELDYPPIRPGGGGRLQVPISVPIPALNPEGTRLAHP